MRISPRATYPNPAYFSVQTGWSYAHYTNASLSGGLMATKITTRGFAPKIALGYDFTSHIAAEFGVIYFHKIIFFGLPGAGSTPKVKNNVIYLVGKLTLPLWRKLGFYFKAGVGYVARGEIRINNIVILSQQNVVMPVYGFGLIYALASHWAFDASFMQVPSNGSVRLPVSTYAGVGVIFKFKV